MGESRGISIEQIVNNACPANSEQLIAKKKIIIKFKIEIKIQIIKFNLKIFFFINFKLI